MSTNTAAPPKGLHPDDKAEIDRILAVDNAQAVLALLGEFVAGRDDAWRAAHAKVVHASVTLLRQGIQPAKIYHRVGVTRSLFNTWTRQAPANLPPFPGDPDADLTVYARERARHIAARDYARELRDATIMALLDGPTALSNAEIGRLAGITGQRVTQMRTGAS